MKEILKTHDKVEIENTTIEGKGVARIDNKVVFVKESMQGDICDIQMRRSHRKYTEADIIQLVVEGEGRVKPHCKHYSLCGGCSLQHIHYEYQLRIKEKHVLDAFQRIGNIEIEEFRPIIGCAETTHYRNKLDFAFSSKRWLTGKEIEELPENADRTGLGFHLAGYFDKVLDIEECFHQDHKSNEVRNFIRDKAKSLEIAFYDVRNHEGEIRNLIIRNTTLGEWMIILCITELNERTRTLLEMIKAEFSFLTAILYTINTKKNDVIYDLEIETFAGKNYIEEKIGNYTFKIRPKSFFQTNSKQAEVLYSKVAEIASLKKSDTVYDLYTGVGSIAIFLAQSAKKIIGIEIVEDAIADAKENAKLNGIENCSFYASDMKKMFNQDFIHTHGSPDVIITDPPRAGMEKEVVESLLHSNCPKIVYVSCNPSSQARDIAILQEKYTVKIVQAIDMFPHTAHVESIALLLLK